jgi:hypothetical protein
VLLLPTLAVVVEIPILAAVVVTERLELLVVELELFLPLQLVSSLVLNLASHQCWVVFIIKVLFIFIFTLGDSEFYFVNLFLYSFCNI